MTPEEIRLARRDVGLMSDAELASLHEKGPANSPPDAWQIVGDELARRKRRIGDDIDLRGGDRRAADFVIGGWLIVGTCIGLLACTALALIPWLQSDRLEPNYAFLILSSLMLFPLTALFALGLAVGVLVAVIMLGKDPTTRTRLNLTVVCAGAFVLVIALGAMLLFWP